MKLYRLVAIAALAAACGDSTGPTSIVGTYRLDAVNGSPLPATLEQGGGIRLLITGGTLTLAASGMYSADIVESLDSLGVVRGISTNVAGSYVIVGTSVTFAHPTLPSKGTISSGKILATQSGIAFSFHRE